MIRLDGFEHPLVLVVAALVTGALTLAALRTRPPGLPWPALPEARSAGATRRDLVRGTAVLLRAGALLALGAVLAGPIATRPASPSSAPGLDLVLAVDVSPSMRALDASRAGEPGTRLGLAREVVARFAERRTAEGDRVGLVVFGETAFTRTPLTRDGAMLADALGALRAGQAGDATALGDALVLAVRRALAGESPGGSGVPHEGRVVVLLTDGRSNAGAVPADVAAEVARGAGVRVHTVGIGTGGRVPVADGPRVRFEQHDLDTAILAHVAARTGGRAFHARSSADLADVYAAIDGLERVQRPLPPQVRRRARPEPLLAAAGGLLACEILLARIARRRLP